MGMDLCALGIPYNTDLLWDDIVHVLPKSRCREEKILDCSFNKIICHLENYGTAH